MVFKQWLLQINISLSALILLPGSQQSHFSWAPAATFAILASWGLTGVFLAFLHKRYLLEYFQKPSTNDTLSTASLVAIRNDAADFARRGDLTSTVGHNSRHDLFGGAEERWSSRRRQSGTTHSRSWTAPMAVSPSNHAAGCAESVTTAKVSSLFTRKSSDDEMQTWPLRGYCWSRNCIATNESRPASQHPTATPALRRLAPKYAMPARMWRHGIHSFLELLRQGLPAPMEHMLAVIYLAYHMMALLYETVPAFEDAWSECLGDLSRYRMAIEDDDIRGPNYQAAVSPSCYIDSAERSSAALLLHHVVDQMP
ncbi:hypothetical protein BBK36DRAFT_1171300 [Trichoderma citrinoviride]|uniref:Uncharacterized protein n=1 Tax=Trichoderma citrinoviride TaxID=58853 RepID=A0A2T4B3Q5_9HYPO|nr:hypothetical protein BBK36DRAFT_1171300 [Trichoderma citrinoviride]PTB63848.1 hypothetical protein BBK36DRAFT_1171300 [Trichoderma citrinoviride]